MSNAQQHALRILADAPLDEFAVTIHRIRRGVSKDRMVARGFGPAQPIATNATSQGREKNRRVEFRVAQRRAAGEVIDVAP